jgi:hypothetical protein
MQIQRIDHVGSIVHDLAAATAVFLEVGLEMLGKATWQARGWNASSGSMT